MVTSCHSYSEGLTNVDLNTFTSTSQSEYWNFCLLALLDPAWHYENPGYQELTAVVTEVSAPNLEGPADISGESHTLTLAFHSKVTRSSKCPPTLSKHVDV